MTVFSKMDHINFCPSLNATSITDIHLCFFRCHYTTHHNISGTTVSFSRLTAFSSMSRFIVTGFCVLPNLSPHQFSKLQLERESILLFPREIVPASHNAVCCNHICPVPSAICTRTMTQYWQVMMARRVPQI